MDIVENALKKQYADATGGPEPIPGSMILDSMKILLDRFSWRPIETAPKDGTTILYYDGYWGVYITSWQEGAGGEWYNGSNPTRIEPTHWMPLPEPPTEEDNKA